MLQTRLAPLTTEVTAALRQARAAHDALPHDDALRAPMDKLLQHVMSVVQCEAHGGRPMLPHRGRFLNKLAPDSASRPLRAAAYDAMDKLVACVWPTKSCADRKQKQRIMDALQQLDQEEELRRVGRPLREMVDELNDALVDIMAYAWNIIHGNQLDDPEYRRSEYLEAVKDVEYYLDRLDTQLHTTGAFLAGTACTDADEKLLDTVHRYTLRMHVEHGLPEVISRYPALVAWIRRMPRPCRIRFKGADCSASNCMCPFSFAPDNTKLKVVHLGSTSDRDYFDEMKSLRCRGELNDAARKKLKHEAEARCKHVEEEAIADRRRELLAALSRIK